MVLSMTRPWKHPKTGMFWLRKRVPAELVEVVGRAEVRQTLSTKDPEEARRRLSEALVELEAKWARLRDGPKVITEREAHVLAREVEQNWLDRYRDDPIEQLYWHPSIYNGLELFTRHAGESQTNEKGQLTVSVQDVVRRSMRALCMDGAKTMLRENGYQEDQWSLLKAARAVAEALQRASLTLEREARGDFDADRGPAQHVSAALANVAPRVSRQIVELSGRRGNSDGSTISEVVEAWWRESRALGRKPSTYQSYSKTCANLAAFLQHKRIRDVSADDVIRFKDFRFANPSRRTGNNVSASTVASDLAGLKAVFGWAASNGFIENDPTAKVTIRAGKRRRLRSPGFSDLEAKAILSRSLALTRGGERPKTYAAKRWVPWLCAFTGARVGELAQLRKEDIQQLDELTIIRITPDAGTVKTDEARLVPLHPQVLELGFAEFVRASEPGHLFLTVRDGADPLGPLQGLKNRLAEFAREVVADPNVAPNHGWRHRFKTVGMELGIAPRILDAIQGQAPRTVAETYGEVTTKTMYQAVSRFPSFEVRFLDDRNSE